MAPKQRNRALTAQVPERVSVRAMTSLSTGAGGRYLAVGLARCARAVVGWAMANPRRAAWVHQALALALGQRQPTAGLIMQTDRGSQ